MSWSDYAKTFKRRQLNSGGAGAAFRLYMRQYDRTETAQERMLLIDQLIHAFHVHLFKHVEGPQPTRPVVPNLIDGRLTDLIPFLDELTYGKNTPRERLDSQEAWRQALKAMEGFFETFRRHSREQRKMMDGD